MIALHTRTSAESQVLFSFPGTKWLNYALIGSLIGSIGFICFYQQIFRRLSIDNESEGEYNTLDEEKTDTGEEGIAEGKEAKKPDS
jgi:hypothetical protein